MAKSLELKICEMCRKSFLRAIPAKSNQGQKYCFHCSSQFVMEQPKLSDYVKSGRLPDRLVQ